MSSAVLIGYGAAIRGTARLTYDRIELGASRKEILNSELRETVKKKMLVRISFFRKGEKKNGGFYVAAEGK